ncbi:Aldehyde dehydrogenase family 3 member F1 [Triticum urartu]|uniref:Aldehyde dehydrogenase family 3 member F1 n=1 Tax=Triticum urartu TaxID=4572 RepID=M7ZBZ1_TRIUA|nr:Aldehyde dehydrogenase family 3 member F1 [Triticum urartu]
MPNHIMHSTNEAAGRGMRMHALQGSMPANLHPTLKMHLRQWYTNQTRAAVTALMGKIIAVDCAGTRIEAPCAAWARDRRDKWAYRRASRHLLTLTVEQKLTVEHWSSRTERASRRAHQVGQRRAAGDREMGGAGEGKLDSLLVTLQCILFVCSRTPAALEPNSAVSWMGAQVWVPLVAFPASAQVVPEPLGVVLIFSCWNFPLGLSLEPLIGAIAAGNAVALKPSELAPATARFLEENIGEYLDATAVKVIQGGPAVGEQLMEHRWDKVLFTGCPRVARVVMAAAAKHLTPVALELGGKCPCIFDAVAGRRNLQTSVNRVIFAKWSSCAGQACIAIDYVLVEERFAPTLIILIFDAVAGRRNLQTSVNRVIFAKWSSCAGQACIAIDYVLVEERFAPTLIKVLKSTLKRFIADSDQMARIVNGRHFQRLSNLLKDPAVAASVLHGGGLDAKNLFPRLRPHQRRLHQVKKIEDSIAFVRARPKPLAVYAFTDSAPLKRRIVEETSSGSVTFNDAVVQFGVDTLPFGGVGQSGFGQYHGKYSFEMFSHKKAVLRRGFLVEAMLRYPPWDEQKIAMMRHLFRYDYVRFIFTFLGLRR